MTQPHDNEKAQLTRLMRSIAREVAYEVLDEHIEDYEHNQRRQTQLNWRVKHGQTNRIPGKTS